MYGPSLPELKSSSMIEPYVQAFEVLSIGILFWAIYGNSSARGGICVSEVGEGGDTWKSVVVPAHFSGCSVHTYTYKKKN